MFKPITKNLNIENRKSYLGNSVSLYLPGFNINNSSLDVEESISYYVKTSPLYTAIKLIADNLKNIDFVIEDTQREEFIYNHEVLKKLNTPSPFCTKSQFIESIISFYILSGDAFVNIIGNNKPVELSVLASQYVTSESDFGNGVINEYTYNPSNSPSITYKRDNNNRYISNNGNELINLKNFNPSFGVNNTRGLSYVEPIKKELAQYLLASIHNESLLKNQGRPSGLLTYKSEHPLSQEQIDHLNAFIEEQYTGVENTGRAGFLSGDYDWKQLSESVKDMDFAKLKMQTSIAVFNALKIPLPMISPEHTTMSNMEIAKLNFYDNTIIPFFNMICSFLGKALLPRYGKNDNLILTYDEASIAALRPRKIENTERLSKSGVLTINEIRSLLGYEDIEGGNTLYQPAALVPIGRDQYTDDNREQPAKKQYKSQERDEFVKVMRAQVNLKNEKMFSEKEIEELAAEYYGSIN